LALNDAVTILVVEDDQLIQAMIEEALSDGGFASALTASGEGSNCSSPGWQIQIPGGRDRHQRAGKARWMGGRSRRPREIDPTMPIIYMTGTHGEEWTSKGVPNSLLLAKPFAPAQIVTAIPAS
jgi:DNA-binding response OmpR family regulator